MKKLLTIVLILAFATNSFAILTWTQRQSLGGINRDRATGFTIGNEIFVGTGLGPAGFLKPMRQIDSITIILPPIILILLKSIFHSS